METIKSQMIMEAQMTFPQTGIRQEGFLSKQVHVL